MNVLVPGLTTVMALVLGLSGVSKLGALHHSQQTVRALRLDVGLVRPKALVAAIAVLECLLAGALATSAGALRVAVALACLGTTSIFLLVAVRAAKLGSSEECGCFGAVLPMRVGGALIRRAIVLTGVAATLVAVSASPEGVVVRSVAAGLGEAFPAVVLATVALGCGMVLAAGGWRAAQEERASPSVGVVDSGGAVIVAEDGEVVDPVQRALRGRAQLLVFVRPGCSSCEDVSAVLRATPLRSAEPRIIRTVGDGGHLALGRTDRPAAEAVREHVDPAGRVANHLRAPGPRPCAVLVTTAGRVLEPKAEGRDQVLRLIDAIAVAEGLARDDRGGVGAGGAGAGVHDEDVDGGAREGSGIRRALD